MRVRRLARMGLCVGAFAAGVAALPVKATFVGDSFTAPADGWVERWAAFPANAAIPFAKVAASGRALGTVANLNDGGNTLWGHAATTLATLPSMLVILIGPNDTLGAGDGSAYAENVMAFGDYMKAQRPGLKIIIMTQMPRGDLSTETNTNYNARRYVAEAAYRAAMGTRISAVGPVATHPIMTDAQATAGSPYFDTALLHPSGLGQTLLSEIANAVVGPVALAATAANPSAFTFAPVTNAEPSTVTTGGTVLLTGMASASSVAVAASGAGLVSVGQSAFSATPGNAINGDAIRPRRTSSAEFSTPAATTVSAGTTTAEFSVTTRPANPVTVDNLTELPLTFSGASPQTSPGTFVMAAAGRPVFFYSLFAAAFPAIVILDANNADAQVATCTNATGQLNASNSRYGFARSNVELPAGTYRVKVTAGSISNTTQVFPLILTNSNGGVDTGGTSTANFAYKNPGAMAGLASVTVNGGGIGLTMAYSGGFSGLNGHTLVHQYTGTTPAWGLYSFASTQTPTLTIGTGAAAGSVSAAFQ